MATNTYELSIGIEKDGNITVTPCKMYGTKQVYQASLESFCFNLADNLAKEEADEYSDSFVEIFTHGDSEVVIDYLLGIGCVEGFFEHECYDSPIIEMSGVFSCLDPLTYDLKVVVTDPSSTADMVILCG